MEWDETMQGSGRGGGVREVFLGDNIPTVTHEQASYVKNIPGYSTSNVLSTGRGHFACPLLTFCDARYSMPRAT